VVLAIAFVTCGARAVGDAIAGPPAPPVEVPGVVRVQPAPGWELAAREDDGAEHRFLLRRGTAGLFVSAIEGFGRPASDVATSYVRGVLDQELARLTVEQPSEDVVLASGQPALRFGYVGETDDGSSVEGVITVVVPASGNAVVFDGFAAVGDLAWAIDDLRAMVDGAVVA
jgi:hypothetical protein